MCCYTSGFSIHQFTNTNFYYNFNIKKRFMSPIFPYRLLHLAIILPHPQVSKTLISLAPQPIYLNIQNDVYLAPLHLAVLTSQPTIVRDLIIGGAKVRESLYRIYWRLIWVDWVGSVQTAPIKFHGFTLGDSKHKITVTNNDKDTSVAQIFISWYFL